MKTLCINIEHFDADAIGEIYCALRSVPCAIEINQEKQELYITTHQSNTAFVESVVAQYV